MRVVVLAHKHLQVVGHLPAAFQSRNQTALQRKLGGIAVDGGERSGLVGHELVERAGGQRAGVSHVLLIGVPQRLQPHRTLFALACRHVAARELVGETLVRARAKHVDIDTQLLDGVLQIHAVVAETVEVNQPQRIEIDLAGLRCQVVLGLIQRVGGHHHALARGAKIAQRSADFLQLRQARRIQGA